MNIKKRTCSNCAAYNPTTNGDEPTCWNLVSITEWPGTPQALTRQPGPDDDCHDHQTYEEDGAETALIEEHREEGGMEQAIAAMSSIANARYVIRQAQR